ncbi:S8/S53 family peptidase [Bosea psychrotolerans]|uniref:Subtilase family protein n=1 Tax=Bosea psychrotolerans TaxID=1871628 RepID=A0A2S4MDU4_9HYPH|nr:S8/S53 family peptidase [Bosea psychrotolerans]POR52607.1 subtilase family protein [Bosea psychrotolerans]
MLPSFKATCLAGGLLFILQSHAWAQSQTLTPAANASQLPPQIINVELDGGLAAENMAEILKFLRKKGVALATRPAKAEPGETICSVLLRFNYPTPCGPLGDLILTEQANLRRINQPLIESREAANTVFYLPDIDIVQRQTSRAIPNRSNDPFRAENFVKNWKDHKAILYDRRLTEVTVQYVLYRLNIPIPAEFPADAVLKELAALPLNNVSYDMTVPGQTRFKQNAIPADFDESSVRELCKNYKDPADLLSLTRPYSAFSDMDTDAIEATRIYTGIVDAAPKPFVHLLDTKLSPLPSLYPAYGEQPVPLPSKCDWAFTPGAHHANLLAGIIASQGKGTGFEGIAPNVNLRSFDIFDPDNTNAKPIHEYIEENTYDQPGAVFLIANDRPSAYDKAPTLPVRNTRFREPLATTLLLKGGIQRPFVVVAAGQPDKPADPVINIDARTNMFPQNLGDLPNVVVVTACTDCSKATAEVYPKANYSADSWKFVHVAAPGGQPISGWTGPDTFGAAFGTSQSAAFVAGVAANMIRRHPDVYGHNGALKYRLQTCAWPLPHYNASGVANGDVAKIATGVIDPAVCNLNPRKSWVKDGNGWRPVDFKRWAPNTMFSPGQSPPGRVLRIMRTAQAPAAEWTLYVDRDGDDDADSQIELGLGQVRKVPVTKLSTAAGIELCDGTTVRFADGVRDFYRASMRQGCP